MANTSKDSKRPHPRDPQTVNRIVGGFWLSSWLSFDLFDAESGGDGWESNPPRTRHRRPADGFEDRGTSVRDPSLASAPARVTPARFRSDSRTSPFVCPRGCQLAVNSHAFEMLALGDVESTKAVKAG